MPFARSLKPLLIIFLVALLSGCGNNVAPQATPGSTISRPLREVRYVMGTLLDITLYPPADQDARAVIEEAFAIAERLDNSLSTYKPTSALSRFNADHTTAMRPVDQDLYLLVKRANELSRQTDGGFDVTVRPLVEIWKMAAQRGYSPTKHERAELRKTVGYHKLSLGAPLLLGKAAAEVQVESGGIGKGFAVDEIVATLRARGVKSAFINFGRSSMAAIGSPPGESGWPVTLELEEGQPEGELSLRDETLTVSRARGEPFVVAGVSYAHIFDPQTLAPVKKVRGAAIRSVSATDGEAYVKFLVLRGPPPKQVEQRWGEVRWFVKDQGKGMVRSTKR